MKNHKLFVIPNTLEILYVSSERIDTFMYFLWYDVDCAAATAMMMMMPCRQRCECSYFVSSTMYNAHSHIIEKWLFDSITYLLLFQKYYTLYVRMYSTNHDWNDKWMSCINLILFVFLHIHFSRCSLWLNLYSYWARVCMMNHPFYIWEDENEEEKKKKSTQHKIQHSRDIIGGTLFFFFFHSVSFSSVLLSFFFLFTRSWFFGLSAHRMLDTVERYSFTVCMEALFFWLSESICFFLFIFV